MNQKTKLIISSIIGLFGGFLSYLLIDFARSMGCGDSQGLDNQIACYASFTPFVYSVYIFIGFFVSFFISYLIIELALFLKNKYFS